jgi:hypothetical protein
MAKCKRLKAKGSRLEAKAEIQVEVKVKVEDKS